MQYSGLRWGQSFVRQWQSYRRLGEVLQAAEDCTPETHEQAWRAVYECLGWCCFIGTPKGHNHFKDLRDRAETEDGWGLLEFKASQTDGLAGATIGEEANLVVGEQHDPCLTDVIWV